MTDVLTRIDEWEATGLIDRETAERLREAEAVRAPEAVASGPPTDAVERQRGLTLSSIFGPGVTIGEMFAYLGGAFLLGAWTAFATRLAGGSGDALAGAGFAIAAAGLVVLGVSLLTDDARRRRGAGVAFAVAPAYVAAATAALIPNSYVGPGQVLLVAVSGFLAAAVLRRVHAALLTEASLLAAATALGAAALSWLRYTIEPDFDGFNGDEVAAFDPGLLVVLNVVGWLLIGLALGLYAIRVAARSEASLATVRRAALIRGWAGILSVLGTTTALTTQAYVAEEYVRVVPAWMADVAILALAIVLVERAFRRDSAAFLVAAGVGFIAALTDFNFTYLTETTELGLLVEGVILLAVGFVADRLRRRLSRDPDDADLPAEPEPPRTVAPAPDQL
jgi:hypothetical protein